jgi:hypothetical protein
MGVQGWDRAGRRVDLPFGEPEPLGRREVAGVEVPVDGLEFVPVDGGTACGVWALAWPRRHNASKHAHNKHPGVVDMLNTRENGALDLAPPMRSRS